MISLDFSLNQADLDQDESTDLKSISIKNSARKLRVREYKWCIKHMMFSNKQPKHVLGIRVGANLMVLGLLTMRVILMVVCFFYAKSLTVTQYWHILTVYISPCYSNKIQIKIFNKDYVNVKGYNLVAWCDPWKSYTIFSKLSSPIEFQFVQLLTFSSHQWYHQGYIWL